jgi:ATP-dependent protease HslVU (ClpYQ) peptidase subunit
MDMDDAIAVGSLKTTVVSDQTTSGLLSLADSIEQQSSTAAPGSGAMLATEAQIASLQSQAYLAKVLAAELRQEATKLAHQNALIKQSALNVRTLQNQMQQVLAHP